MQSKRKEVMDPSLWSQLPEELLDRILSLLPLPALLSLRPTCKRFHSLLSTPSFLSLLSASSSSSPSSSLLLLSHPQFLPYHLSLFSPSSGLWRSFPLPSSHPHLLSSAAGLLLFSSSSSSSASSFLLLNPLSLSSRLLPAPFPTPSSSTLLSLSKSHYFIFLPSPNPNLTFLYDSLSSSWSSLPSPSLPQSPQKPAFLNGRVYFTTQEPFSVVSLNLMSKEWLPDATDLPSDLAFARLVSGEGKDGKGLFFVGGVGQNGISRSLMVWGMVEGGRRWEEVGRLPEMMLRKFVAVCYHNYSHVYCLWHDGMVCICCTTWPEVLFFRVARRTWHWLPRCPALQEKWSCGFRWFSFIPDLFGKV